MNDSRLSACACVPNPHLSHATPTYLPPHRLLAGAAQDRLAAQRDDISRSFKIASAQRNAAARRAGSARKLEAYDKRITKLHELELKFNENADLWTAHKKDLLESPE
jgi:hypothetical protein